VLAPTWLTDSLAAAMLAVAGYCAVRLLVARHRHRTTHHSVDALHIAMGVAMAGMLSPGLGLDDKTRWVVVFVAAAGWFGLRAARGLVGVRSRASAVGSHLSHVLTSGAMVYMLTATPTAAFASTGSTARMNMTHMSMKGMAGMGASTPARFPTLALVLGVFMVGYTVVILDRMSRSRPTPADGDRPTILAPRAEACCQVAMNITMGYMLVTLL
jgi:uncharacterized protein DUF5134